MRQAHKALSTSLRRASGSKRLASSSSSAGKRPTAPVPKHRMRALVSLYHESDLFVTPSNLSATIDQEFVHKSSQQTGITHGDDLNYADLEKQYRSRKALPKIGDSRVVGELDPVKPKEWSASRNMRESQVMRALYGLDVGRRPGLEVLEEESDRVRKEIIQPDARMFKPESS